jgi:serine/threonine protein phosphatase PrpC
MSKEDKQLYISEFSNFDTDMDGYITIDQIKVVFGDSNIENEELTRIWGLADVDEDRRLDNEEFALANYLIKIKLKGVSIPYVLPDSLIESVNPIWLSYRHSSLSNYDDEEDLRAIRGRSNAFYSGNSAVSDRILDRLFLDNLEVKLPDPSQSVLIIPSKDLSASSKEGKIKSSSSRFAIGIADTIGRRPHMEDEIVIVGQFRGKEEEDMVALFDGHGGRAAVDFVLKKFHLILEEKLTSSSSSSSSIEMSSILKDAFLECNELMKKDKVEGGATAICALFLQDKLYIANCGDSRAVLCYNGNTLRCSVDHRPDLPDEEKRIRALGGHITTSIDRLGKVTSRVCGRLAVSRAFGDFLLEPYVTADPYVFGPHSINLPNNNSFLILACDGVWDKVSDEDAVNIVSCIPDPQQAAAKLRDFAFSEGSDDNISVVVVRFSDPD